MLLGFLLLGNSIIVDLKMGLGRGWGWTPGAAGVFLVGKQLLHHH